MQSKKISKTQSIVTAMRQGAEYTTVELQSLSGVPSKVVPALLGGHIKKGLVSVTQDYPKKYRKATDLELIKPQIERAIRLLARFGYSVEKAGP